MQATHEPAPVFEYVPATHVEQLTASPSEYRPASHEEHVVAPVASPVLKPAVQSRHASWPGAGWYLPLVHASHTVKPVPLDTLPTAQFRQLEAPAPLYVPLVQFEQGD